MFRTFTFSTIAALPFLFVQPALAPTCPNTIRHEPLVVFDVSGGTLAGLVDLQLTVYNDGIARVCQSASLTGAVDARLAYVTPLEATNLARDLSILGAGTLCDLDSMFTDTPTSTLTVLRGTTDSPSHTFSWVGGQGPYALVEQRLFTFIQAAFPGF